MGNARQSSVKQQENHLGLTLNVTGEAALSETLLSGGHWSSETENKPEKTQTQQPDPGFT